MRNEFISQFAELNATTLENLTREVKESVAVNTHEDNTKQVFTAANLWNIHNRRRVREPRRENGTREREVNRDTRGRKFSGGNDFARLFVNLGTKDGFYKASFLQFILDMSELQKEVLGRIDMKEMNSWIEIDKKAANQMIRSIDGKKFKGRKIRMNDANSR